jgi:hypothetical protein
MTIAIIIGVLVVAGIWGCARILRNWYAKDIAENKTKRFTEWLAFRMARWHRRDPKPTPTQAPDPNKPAEPFKPSKPVWIKRLLHWDVYCPCGEKFTCRLRLNSSICSRCGSVITRNEAI